MSAHIEVTRKRKIKKTRRLKVAYNKQLNSDETVPAIRFSGQYLEAVGFEVGKFFIMEIDGDGTITI